MHKYRILLVFIVFSAYLNSFSNAFVWDDINNIVNNTALEAPLNLKNIFIDPPGRYYRPIPFLTMYMDHLLWGRRPFGFHLTNIILHTLCVLLFFSLMRAFTGDMKHSFFLSALFAVHPANTEAVSYISGRSDPVCLLFIMLSMLFYMRRRILPAVLFFLSALFSKETVLVFPLLVILYDIYFFNKEGRAGRIFPFMAVEALFLVFALGRSVYYTAGVSCGSLPEAGKGFLLYTGFMLFPLNVHMHHTAGDPVSYTAVIIFMGIIMSLKMRDKTGIFGFMWFLIFILPFLGIIRFGGFIAEHWLYPAFFGFFLFISRSRIMRHKLLFACLCVFFFVITVRRNYVWRSDISIYKDTLKYTPRDAGLRYNLGNAYLRRGMYGEALKEYREALLLSPGHKNASRNMRYAAYKLTTAQALYAAENGIDDSLYAGVLRLYLKGGRVDYASLKQNRGALDKYIREIGSADVSSLSRSAQTAFYINAYNAITIRAVTDNYPVKSIKDIDGVWDRLLFRAGGRDVTLNYIENEILRKEFKEPRIHFALVCASIGCPELKTSPYTAAGLDAELDMQAKLFINNKEKVRLDRKHKRLYVSRIFKWFKKDFGDVKGFIMKYLNPEDASFVKNNKIKLKYLRYDWSLNKRI